LIRRLETMRSKSFVLTRALKNSQLTFGDVTIICETVH
jgi:hypothetical protein